MRRSLQLVLLALLAGAPAVWAAFRHARAAEAIDQLRAAATAHTRTSYRGSVVWAQVKTVSRPKIPWKGNWPGFSKKGTSKGDPQAFSKSGWMGGPNASSKVPPMGGWMGGGGWKSDWNPSRTGVRHDAVSGRTAYRFGWSRHREFVVAKPSCRMPDPPAWCVDVDALVRNYRARELKSAEYLGRAVRVLRAVPRHAGRPTLEIWVDEVSGLPLKVSTFRSDGSLYRIAKFERIEFGPQQVKEVDLQHAHRFVGSPVSLENPQEAAGFVPLQPEYLPQGFRLVQARVKQRATPQLTQLFSDGATAFELQQSPKPTPAVVEDHYRWMGERGAKRMVENFMRTARQRLVHADDGEDTTVVCRPFFGHLNFELRVDDLELRLSARGDLDKAEMLKVLRSLRP